MNHRPNVLRCATLSGLIVAMLCAATKAGPPSALRPTVVAATGPGALSLLGEIDLLGTPWSAAVTGDRAYVIDTYCARGTGLQVVDLTDEASPRARGRACGLADGSNLMAVAAEGGLVALMPAITKVPFLVDARDPDHIKRGGSAEVFGGLSGPFMIHDLMLVLRQHNSGNLPDYVIAFDISDPSTPRETGRLSLAPSPIADFSDGLAAYQGVYYVIEGDLRVIKLNAEGAPTLIGSAPMPRRESASVDLLAIDTAARRLYAVDDLHLWIYDVANPEAPSLLAEAVSPPLPEFDHHGLAFKIGSLVVRDNVALAKIDIWPSSEGALIVAFDMTNPAAPRQIDVQSPFAYVDMGLDAMGNLVAVGDRDTMSRIGGRLHVFDIGARPEQLWKSWLPVMFDGFSD